MLLHLFVTFVRSRCVVCVCVSCLPCPALRLFVRFGVCYVCCVALACCYVLFVVVVALTLRVCLRCYFVYDVVICTHCH